jgi:hypothetical protein
MILRPGPEPSIFPKLLATNGPDFVNMKFLEAVHAGSWPFVGEKRLELTRDGSGWWRKVPSAVFWRAAKALLSFSYF